MNINELYCGAAGALKALASSSVVKFILAALAAVLLHKHAIIFYCFALLVFIDCLTRWAAIGHDYLVSHGEEEPTYWDCVLAIKPARSVGLITSKVMKHRFLGKIAVYLVCVLAGVSVDYAMLSMSQPTWAVVMVVGYLTATELLSIIENLNAAGVEAVQGLVDAIKKKGGIK